jgi:hypothetical protein
MTTLNLLSAALVAAAMIATPAMARESHVTARRAAENASAAASVSACVRAPRVGAFATQPWTNPPCEPSSGF